MIQKASEILTNALNLSQLNETEALSWKRKVTLFNTAFTALWDKVVSHEDDFVLKKTELQTPARLPDDLYSVRAVYHRHDQLRRNSNFNKLSTDSYRIIDNMIYTNSGVRTVTLYYNTKPPTITFPNEPIELAGNKYKINNETLAFFDGQAFKCYNIVTGSEYRQDGNADYEWDIYNGNIVQNINGNLTVNSTAVDVGVDDYIINAYLDYKIGDVFYRLDYNNNIVQLPDDYEFAHYIDGLPYTFANNTLYQGEVEIGTFQKVLFADPYILVKKLSNEWWVYSENAEWQIEARGEVLSANWNDDNGYGMVIQTPAATQLHSFYPDTVLDWPNTMYFDWLEAAIAADMKKQVEQDPASMEEIKAERWSILQSHLNRNRGDAYKISNPYSMRGGW